ncbi:MAG: glycoside hydrolase family 43 protein, partial [Acidobacteriota bacterium]|nr:glycoside hydrolase family 43 protein [Acidobacteriota bacterium]
MSERQISGHPDYYLNPVSAHPFADPFVLEYCGEYWAYSTDFWPDGRCFGILHSRDLVHWTKVGGAMEPLPGGHTCYWAPEVSYDNGRLLMYYSVGNEERMQIRVAVATHPAGPFVDSGRQLTTEEFAIDPHVFVDDDGAKYLFYATDFLTHTHIGTGTVMDRMLDWFTLAGDARPATRARYDWQVYDQQRASKGGVRWHTVEGPCVLKHKGRYYQMFSGGNWQNLSYGVSYAFTNNLNTTDEWQQVSDGASVLPILRTLPGKVIGPGHNSAVRGPDNQQWFCVYHRWADDGSARLMCIDPLDWVGQEMIVLGPTAEAQPAPNLPTFADFFVGGGKGTGSVSDLSLGKQAHPEEADRARSQFPTSQLGENWECTGGRWTIRQACAVQDALDYEAEARARFNASSFIAEVSVQSLRTADKHAGCGIAVQGGRGTLLRALLLPAQNCLSIAAGNSDEERFTLPREFDAQAFHLFRVEVNGLTACLQIDQGLLYWETRLAEAAQTIALVANQAPAAFAGFALTAGWEDLFIQQNSDLQNIGWQVVEGEWIMSDGQLQQQNPQADALIIKDLPLMSSISPMGFYELVINARLLEATSISARYGICLIRPEPRQKRLAPPLWGRRSFLWGAGSSAALADSTPAASLSRATR